ncbi:MAG TPA: DUF6112 family protein [Acidimicrobiales bacterium]|nr:DUF6112 family protein [Acidimicrobiales bacterium]
MRALLVLASGGVTVTPNASGLPGVSTVVSMLGGLQIYGEIVCIVGLIAGAAWWAISSHSSNYQGAAHGRSAVVVSALAGLVVGFAPALVNWFFNLGLAAH